MVCVNGNALVVQTDGDVLWSDVGGDHVGEPFDDVNHGRACDCRK
jgi:hypothetical protein